MCVEHGVDGILVSTHGGRQVDGTLSSVETLPEIVEAAGDAPRSTWMGEYEGAPTCLGRSLWELGRCLLAAPSFGAWWWVGSPEWGRS